MAGRLFELQSRNGILEEKDRRLYEYAYGVLLGRVVIYLIIVILGIITGNWMEMIVFLLPINFFLFRIQLLAAGIYRRHDKYNANRDKPYDPHLPYYSRSRRQIQTA